MAYRNELRMPVIGLEAEFKVFVDEREIVPEEYWRTPNAFIRRKMLRRSTKASQLPTGGAVYFDGGVVEVVTPVIEIAPRCTARAVRSLWEQIGFIRDELDAWEVENAKRVRLQAFSCHTNVSFELPREERNRNRTIQKLALLLMHVLAVPTIVAGANRGSTGVGVRPRRDRIEITFDFTPDPGLMSATTALIVGVARDVIAWPSYRLDELQTRGIATLAQFDPGRHETRKGWIARPSHFTRNPFTEPIDANVWTTSSGETKSLRAIALDIATIFRNSIRRVSDPFGYRILFSVLRGEALSLLDLDERPAEYDDVGRAIRWGGALSDLHNESSAMQDDDPGRSQYENVFLRLATGKQMRIERELLTPIGVKGWYHALFRNASGDERLLSIDQVLDALASASQ